jgi:hypothetical protein
MSDHEIRTLLTELAEDVQDVRPLSRRALRRTRARRWSIAATVVASVATLAVGGAGLALDAGPFGTARPVVPVGPPDQTPPPPAPMRGTVVGYGTTPDGREWWLSAYEDEAGQLCVDLQHDTGDLRSSCSYFDPEGTGFAKDPDDGPGPRNVFGWVPEDTEAVWVTWGSDVYEDGGPEDEEPDDGEGPEAATSEHTPAGGEESQAGPDVEIRGDEEVTLFDAPEGFPFPAKFYALVPAPEDAEALRVDLANGDATVLIVARPDRVDHAGSTYRGERVAEGHHGGYAWELYERTPGDNRCIHLVWADEDFGSSEGCSTAVPRAESFQFTMARFGGEESSTVAFFAAMAEEVSSLELTLEDGTVMGLEILEGPEGSDVDYAVGWPPLNENGSTGGTVTARDADGNVLDAMELCELATGDANCTSDSPPP